MHHETLRIWVRGAEVDEGRRPGLTTDERARLKELGRENRELHRANEILKRDPQVGVGPLRDDARARGLQRRNDFGREHEPFALDSRP